MNNRTKLLTNIESIFDLASEVNDCNAVKFVLSKCGVSNVVEASENELQEIFNELFTLITT